MIKMKRLLAVSLLLTFVESRDLRIVNGDDCNPEEFPFMASLQEDGKHFCGGTVVNELFILTAAHCVCDKSFQNFNIFLTKSNNYHDQNSIKIPYKSIICHDYSQIERINDIALIQLSTFIPKNFYNPVKLASIDFVTHNNLNGVLVGWGLTSTNGNLPKILQRVDVIVFNDSICSQSYYGMYDMTRNMCAGWPEDGRGSCQGDSGGPLLVNNIQVGIIGFGKSGDCSVSNEKFPKVLTRITHYIDWIEEKSKVLDIDFGDMNDNSGVKQGFSIKLILIFSFITFIS